MKIMTEAAEQVYPNHMMVDIETLGTSEDAMILSIGAVIFNERDGAIDGKYWVIRPETRVGSISHDTVAWWMQQSEAARVEVFGDPALQEYSFGLYDAVTDLVNTTKEWDIQGIWGNGVDFDNKILGYWANLYDLQWPFRLNRCYRAIKNMFPPSIEHHPTVAHNAYDDAMAQAKTLLEICEQYGFELR